MSSHRFIDSDGDEYTVSASGEHNIALTYQNPEVGGVDLFIFKVEDAQSIADAILAVAREQRQQALGEKDERGRDDYLRRKGHPGWEPEQ